MHSHEVEHADAGKTKAQLDTKGKVSRVGSFDHKHVKTLTNSDSHRHDRTVIKSTSTIALYPSRELKDHSGSRGLVKQHSQDKHGHEHGHDRVIDYGSLQGSCA